MKKALLYFILQAATQLAFGQDVPVPTGLSAKYVGTDSVNYISLTWDAKDEGDTITTGYNLLVNFPPSQELLISGKVGVIYKNSYLYPIHITRAANYRFALVGICNFPKLVRSGKSKVVEIKVPSQRLPFIEIKHTESDKGVVKLSWSYPDDIIDLDGFNLYVNGKLQTKISKDKRSYQIELNEKGKYIFQLAAITESGLESPYSQKRLVKIIN